MNGVIVGFVTNIPTAGYLSAWQVLGNLEIAEVLRDYVASNPQREHIPRRYFCCGSLLFLLSVFILWFSYYVSDIFCKF